MQIVSPSAMRKKAAVPYSCLLKWVSTSSKCTSESYFAIAQECRLLGLTFAGHVPAKDMEFAVTGIEASNAGQKSLEHMFGIPFPGDKSIPSLLATLGKNGTWVTPTLTVFFNRARFEAIEKTPDPRSGFIAPALKQFWGIQTQQWSHNPVMEKLYQARMTGVKALQEAGIRMLAGTDLGFPQVYPGDLPKELEHLVDAGVSPAQALRVATLNPAVFLGLEKDLGTIEPGKLADIVILDGNPIEKIQNLAFVHAVVFNGRLLRKPALDAALARF